MKNILVEKHEIAEASSQVRLLEAGKVLKDDTRMGQLSEVRPPRFPSLHACAARDSNTANRLSPPQATQSAEGFLVAMVQPAKRKKPRPRKPTTLSAAEVPATPLLAPPAIDNVVEAHLAEKSELLAGISGLDMNHFGSRVKGNARQALETEAGDLFSSFLEEADRAREEDTAMSTGENEEPLALLPPPCRGACVSINRGSAAAAAEEGTEDEAAATPLGISPENVTEPTFSSVLQRKDANVEKRGRGARRG